MYIGSNEPLGSMEGGDFLDWLSYSKLLKTDFVPWSQYVNLLFVCVYVCAYVCMYDKEYNFGSPKPN